MIKIISVIVLFGCCFSSAWANGFSPSLSNDLCRYHAALAKEFMGMRLDGKTESEVLNEVKKRKDGWALNGLPKEYGAVNEKLVRVIYASPPLKNKDERELLLTLLEDEVLTQCLGSDKADAQASTDDFRVESNGSDYVFHNQHDCSRVSSYAFDVMTKRQDVGGLLADQLSDLYENANDGGSAWWGVFIRLTIEAYQYPQWPDEATRLYISNQFANTAMAKCLG